MDNAEARELGKFRRTIERADLHDLVPILASILDECIDVLRGLNPGSTMGVEMAAAVSAELHKRHVRALPSLHRLEGNA